MIVSLPHLAHHFPVIGPGCIQQQQRMPGGRSVYNDKMVVGLFDDPGECLKHGNLFGAGGTEIFLQYRQSLFIQTFSLIFQHKATIALSLCFWIDTADLKAWQRAIQGVRQVAAGSEVVRWTL